MTEPSAVVTFEIRDRVALVGVDHPPVNAISRDVRAGLRDAIARAAADPGVDAVVLFGVGRTFPAGADIREFGKPPASPILFEVCLAIEDGPKPVVAAVAGTALGGGCELALAAHARVASAEAKFAQPEVNLGILPGGGGTQRLPRLVGMAKAIEMNASGKPISAEEARALGLVDEIAAGDLLETAIAHAKSLVGRPLRRTRDLPVPPFDRAAAETQIAAIDERARGQISPGEAARMTLRAADLAFAEGQAAEREVFLRLVASDEAAALRHVFFAEREVAKVAKCEGVAPRPIVRVGVVGAGTMGAGIAVAFADAGYAVTVIETSEAALAAGRDRIDALWARAVASGRLTEAEKAAKLATLALSTDLAALAEADLVVEAVFDDRDVKRDLFAQLADEVRADCILATNTSYLDPNDLAEVVTHPDRFVGLHFFSPANVMRLVEVVDGAATSPETLATALAVAKRLKKLAVVVGVCEGFVGNRIWAAFRRECEFLLEDGALPEAIDAAMEGFGLAMGPFAVFDLSGLDIAWSLRKRKAATRDPNERYVAIADRLCEAGRFGRKTGAGWYAYPDGKKTVDPTVTAIVEAESAVKGIVRRAFSAAEIVDRLVAVMGREGDAILAEGIAARASDIDLVFVNGYGWPPRLGGPMFQAAKRRS
ncbi:MAG: 3-hydroxyacyl-CoA dehydrogenase NAD-binding domain-containing protein [Hyphomicrobiales bacterium]|nr:3-hydroxyacyl-CoA dehydrogenase NAD-binding domain-containing protein [Hyphomicrobiales bacterium]